MSTESAVSDADTAAPGWAVAVKSTRIVSPRDTRRAVARWSPAVVPSRQTAAVKPPVPLVVWAPEGTEPDPAPVLHVTVAPAYAAPTTSVTCTDRVTCVFT